MIFNEAGLQLLKDFEGCRLTRYHDVAGVSTIGYGHTGMMPEPARAVGWPPMPETILQEQADWLLAYDASQFAGAVELLVEAATDNQFSAMVCLAYNIGLNAFKGSTLLRLHRNHNYPATAEAFMSWDKAHVDGQLVIVKGLFNRRTAESNLYRKET